MIDKNNNEYQMQSETISGAKSAAVEAGMYEARFLGKKPISSKNPEYGDSWQWEFEGIDGKKYFGFCGKTSPTIQNQYGRFLACLLGKMPAADMTVNPAEYIGKRYMLFYAPDAKTGRVKLSSFKPCA